MYFYLFLKEYNESLEKDRKRKRNKGTEDGNDLEEDLVNSKVTKINRKKIRSKLR